MSNWIIFIQASLLEQKRSYNLLEYNRAYLFKNGLIKWFAKNHTANFEKSQSRIQFIASKLYALSAKVQFSCSVMSNSLRPPVHHQLLEFTLTHVHWVGNAIKLTHPLVSPSSPSAFNLSQHQGLSRWVSSSHQVAKVLEFQLQHQSFQWIFSTDFL